MKRTGLVTRIAQAATYVFGGSTPDGWFPPLAPLAPLAPPEVAGRQFDYPSGYNLNSQPRADEAIGFPQLRALAENYDLLRLVIETRKDQLANLRWSIKPRDKAKHGGDDPRVKRITDFLAYPDREHAWDQWLRMLVEDLLVIDAPALYPRRTLAGDLYALEPIDGATIKRVIDDYGRTPLAPTPAYQQVLHGVPAVNYTTDQLLYFPRNLRTNRVYGYSPVEQIVITVNTALRRQMHKLEFYTAGSVPDALGGVPDNWNVGQIGEWQQYWDALLTDDTAARRRVRWVPAAIAKAFVQTKEAALKDEFDEWLARIVCYALSVSPQWAIKQMNRATSDTAQEQALQEGLAPLQAWAKSALDRILARCFDAPDLELSWEETQEIDPGDQAKVADTYLRAGVLTINEVRSDLGRDPVDGGDEPLLFFGSGVVPLREALTAGEAAPGDPAPGDPAPGDPAPPSAAMAKRAGGHREADLAGVWQHFFDSEAPRIARQVAHASRRETPMAKAAGDGGEAADEDPEQPELPAAVGAAGAAAAAETPLSAEEAAAIAAAAGNGTGTAGAGAAAAAAAEGGEAGIGEAIAAAIEEAVAAAPWPAMQQTTAVALGAAARGGVAEGTGALGQIVAGISTQDITNLANPRAVAWAQARAAELVRGVAQTTKDSIRALVVRAEQEGWSVARLQGAIETAHAFAPERALLIARTELARADIQGNLTGWQGAMQRTGLTVQKRVVLGMNEKHCVACTSAVLEGAIALDDRFNVGFAPPFHPNCYCTLIPVVGGAMAKSADQPPVRAAAGAIWPAETGAAERPFCDPATQGAAT